MKRNQNVTICENTRLEGWVTGWATGRNGWRFEFSVSPGNVDLDMREHTEADAKADARQIRRELKKCYSYVFNMSGER